MESRCFQNCSQPNREAIDRADVRKSIQTLSQQVIEHYAKDGAAATISWSVYTGTAGIALAFYRVAKLEHLSAEERQFFERKALEFVVRAIEQSSETDIRSSKTASLMSGCCGIFVIAAAIYFRLNNLTQYQKYSNRFYSYADVCKQKDFNPKNSDDLFSGRSGYILSALWLAEETNTELRTADLHDICEAIILSGRKNAQENSKKSSSLRYLFYGKEYIGAAHGLSSVLMALLCVPSFLKEHPQYLPEIQESIDYLLSIQFDDGNFPSSITDPKKVQRGSSDLVHWCHGAPGVIYVMAKAYQLWRTEKYLKSCEKCIDLIWKFGLLKKGPGLCHGISGNAYAFLLMFRLTGNATYLRKAEYFYEFLQSAEFKQGTLTPDHPFSLFEGYAGALFFYCDLLDPKNSTFPFQNVFSRIVFDSSYDFVEN